MSEVLYRKYRPQTFSDVCGQDDAVAVLRSVVLKGKGSLQSIILKGTRGVGKTTLARIIAREMQVNSVDIYELDAASHNGVDEMRRLCDEILTRPIMSDRKVYIFDEVHMFSASTWSVLLKTLEEPPEHVLFIMATTDDHKIPDTIISRSMVVGLRTPGTQAVAELIDRVAESEGVSMTTDARDMIVIAGDGSFRNALVALETVIRSSSDAVISVDTAASALALPPLSFVRQIVQAISYPNKDDLIAILARVPEYNALQTVRMVLVRVRMCLELRFQVIKTVPEGDRELVQTIAKDIAKSRINASLLTGLLRVEYDMAVAADPSLVFQAYLYELLER